MFTPSRPRRIRGLYRTPGFFRACVWHGAYSLTIGRVKYLHCLTGIGINPATIDKTLLTKQTRIIELHGMSLLVCCQSKGNGRLTLFTSSNYP
jgi:hypothetical protein